MAGSVNKVIIVGNVGRDPEVKTTQDDRTIVNISVATSDTWIDKQSGERREKTEWHRVVIFNDGLAKVAEQYVKKGSKIYVEGALQTRSWEDQSGQKRFATEIVLQNFGGRLTLLGDPPGGGGNPNRGRSRDDANPAMQSTAHPPAEMDDEIPF